ncbi:MAG: DNA alkylation repair protein, partial [Alphaproteobacteria bacterium]|nr:DNA alkylation repair protein [Alphaproteobacteria bacterium]
VPARDVVAIGLALAADAPRWIGYELITKHRGARKSLTIRDVERLGRGKLDSWYAVDAFGIYISGPAWRDGQIAEADVKRWARSKDLWWRRAALVSTVPLNAKSGGNGFRTKETLAIATLLIDDREDMVVKALSWALRVLAARDPKAVRQFLGQHADRLAARVKRETHRKITTGKKNYPKR